LPRYAVYGRYFFIWQHCNMTCMNYWQYFFLTVEKPIHTYNIDKIAWTA